MKRSSNTLKRLMLCGPDIARLRYWCTEEWYRRRRAQMDGRTHGRMHGAIDNLRVLASKRQHDDSRLYIMLLSNALVEKLLCPIAFLYLSSSNHAQQQGTQKRTQTDPTKSTRVKYNNGKGGRPGDRHAHATERSQHPPGFLSNYQSIIKRGRRPKDTPVGSQTQVAP